MPSLANPMGTDGFEFVEYTSPNTRALAELFQQMGFIAMAQHRSKEVVLYRQGDINFLINHEQNSFAQAFAKIHGPSICAFALRVRDAGKCLARAVERGAKAHRHRVGPMELQIPAIRGIGRSLVYLVDRYGDNHTIYDVDFVSLQGQGNPAGCSGLGLTQIDHLTHNVQKGRMDTWAQFYQRLFNFQEIRYFDIRGRKTGLRSRAMVSPCGKLRIPINEPTEQGSQIQEYLDAYHGEGIQHIALATDDIYTTVEALRANGIQFMTVPDSYYEVLEQRLPNHGEALTELQKNQILIDGDPNQGGGLLLQIFTETVIGPIFFEIIQRKGNEGFGEGNFQALFEAMERDQLARGKIA